MRKLIPYPQGAITILLCCIMQSFSYAQTISRNPKDNTVTSVVFQDNSAPSVDQLEDILKQYLELGNGHELKLKFSNTQKNGSVISRYTQWYKNIQVAHGSASVILVNNSIKFINANIFKPTQALTITPVLSEAQALQAALAEVNAQEYMWQNVTKSKLTENNSSFQPPVGTLVWVEDFRTDERGKILHLAYRFDIYAKEPVSRDMIFVDATTGKILLKDPIIKHVGATGTSVYSGVVGFDVAKTGSSVYEMYDSNRLVSTYDLGGGTNFGFASLINNSSATFGKSVAVDAHWGATKVYDYWLNEHSRLSYDGAGAELASIVNYDMAYNNAFWTGSFMVYGNGTGMFASGFDPLVSLDVCAHEIGHGVCEYTANLVYEKESGAMNEGFSDIWGAVIEHYAAPDKHMWSMGEEIRTGALRSLSNPNIYDDPDTYGGTHWVNVTGCIPGGTNDQCGVHTNSGVLNHWFYLLAEGGKGTNDLSNSFEVPKLGVKKAAAIAYATEQMLGSTDNYIDCRNTSISVAASTYGSCSREVEAITRAWYAVGVGNAFVPCAPQIGFTVADTFISKVVPGIICPASKTISIPVRVTGNAPTGGNATVAIAAAGTAVNGVDYTINNSPLTFNSGSTATQMVQLTIFDNGAVANDKVLKLYPVITQNGSNASLSYTYDTCVIKITGNKSLPDTGGNKITAINTANVKSKSVTPFFSRSELARSQFIISAKELAAAGVKPNVPVTAIEFNVTEKKSTQAFTNFRIKIDATTVTDLSSGNPTVSTTYYNSNYTTQAGWNTLPLSTNLVWNGTDNLAFETCFTNTSASAENDYIEAIAGSTYAATVAHSNSGSDGCSLPFSSGFNFFSVSKPVIRMVQPAPTTFVEKIVVASKPWEVKPGQNVYFYNDTNGKLIMNIANASTGFGCVSAFIMKQGNGVTPMSAPFAAVNRSVKEFSIIPTNNLGGEGYTLTLFFDTSELAGVNLANLRILATSAATDAQMTENNSQLVAPVMVQGKNAYAFTGTFTGFRQKYFLIDNNITLPKSVGNLSKNNGNIHVINNPFTDKIIISYNLQGNTKAQVNLYDITGKNLLSIEKDLPGSQKYFEVNVSDKLLAPGNYILQVITNSEVLTQKMLKQ